MESSALVNSLAEGYTQCVWDMLNTCQSHVRRGCSTEAEYHIHSGMKCFSP